MQLIVMDEAGLISHVAGEQLIPLGHVMDDVPCPELEADWIALRRKWSASTGNTWEQRSMLADLRFQLTQGPHA